jgi:hypothetical protein
MFDSLRSLLLKFFRVPADPRPPTGTSSSVRVFRASRRYYHYALIRWVLKQAGAVAGIVLFVSVGLPLPEKAVEQLPGEVVEALGPLGVLLGGGQEELDTRLLLERMMVAVETIGVILLIGQMPVTYAMVRLDYELRWYIVTDRSLRIREGINRVREMTMTFANIQNVTIRQGPVQRLLGIADLRVRSAGGGSDESEGEPSSGADEKTSMHVGYFRGVDNAQEIREVVFDRLKSLRSAGLGDPDDSAGSETLASDEDAMVLPALDAARALLAEARELRRSVERLTI